MEELGTFLYRSRHNTLPLDLTAIITKSPANLVKYFTFRDFSVSVFFGSINQIRKKGLNYSWLISKLEESENRNLLFLCAPLLLLLLRVIQSINSIQK